MASVINPILSYVLAQGPSSQKGSRMLSFTLTVNALLAAVLDGNDIEDENTRSDMILVSGPLF